MPFFWAILLILFHIFFAYFGPGIGKIIIVISLLSWSGTAMVVKARVLQVREAAFVMSAKSLGAGNFSRSGCLNKFTSKSKKPEIDKE